MTWDYGWVSARLDSIGGKVMPKAAEEGRFPVTRMPALEIESSGLPQENHRDYEIVDSWGGWLHPVLSETRGKRVWSHNRGHQINLGLPKGGVNTRKR